MRFLVDESTGKLFADLLRKLGYDVIFVGDIMPAATDEEILSAAKKENRILVTDDKDFGELIFRLQKPSTGVILLRTSSTKPEVRLGLLEAFLKTTKVEGKFVVLKEGGARIRKLKQSG